MSSIEEQIVAAYQANLYDPINLKSPVLFTALRIDGLRYGCDIKYDDLTPKELIPESVFTQTWDNNHDTDTTAIFRHSKAFQNSNNWNVQAGVTVGVSSQVQVGVPNVASAQAGVSTEISVAAGGGGEEVTTTGFEVDTTVPLPKMKKSIAEMVVSKARIDTSFTGTIVIIGGSLIVRVGRGDSKVEPGIVTDDDGRVLFDPAHGEVTRGSDGSWSYEYPAFTGHKFANMANQALGDRSKFSGTYQGDIGLSVHVELSAVDLTD